VFFAGADGVRSGASTVFDVTPDMSLRVLRARLRIKARESNLMKPECVPTTSRPAAVAPTDACPPNPCFHSDAEWTLYAVNSATGDLIAAVTDTDPEPYANDKLLAKEHAALEYLFRPETTLRKAAKSAATTTEPDAAAAAKLKAEADAAAAAAAAKKRAEDLAAAAAAAKKKAEDALAAAAAAKLKAEQEERELAQKRADEEAAEAKRRADEDAARKAAAEAAEAKRRADEEAAAEAKRRADEQAAAEAKRHAEEEAARKAAADAAEAKRQADEEAARKAAADAEAKRRADEQAAVEAKRRAEEEAARKAAADAAEAKRRADEEAAQKAAADAAEAKRRADEQAAAEAKRHAEEEAARKAAADAAEAKRRADEQAAAEAKRHAEEEAARKAAEAEAARRAAAEAEAARKAAEAKRLADEEEAKRRADDDAAKKAAETEASKKEDGSEDSGEGEGGEKKVVRVRVRKGRKAGDGDDAAGGDEAEALAKGGSRRRRKATGAGAEFAALVRDAVDTSKESATTISPRSAVVPVEEPELKSSARRRNKDGVESEFSSMVAATKESEDAKKKKAAEATEEDVGSKKSQKKKKKAEEEEEEEAAAKKKEDEAKRKEEEAASAKKKKEEAEKKKKDEEEAAAAKKKREDDDAATAKKKKDEEAAAAAKRKKDEEEAAAKKKKEEEAAAAKKKKEEEEAAAKKKKEEEEEAAAAAKKKEEEAAAAKKKKEEDEAAAKKKKEEDEAAAKKKKEEEEAAAAKKKKEEEVAAAAAKKKEEEAAAAKKKEEEEAAASKKKKEEDEAAAKKKKEEEEAAAAQKKKEEEEAAAKKKEEEEEAAAAKKKKEEEVAAAAAAAKKKADDAAAEAKLKEERELAKKKADADAAGAKADLAAAVKGDDSDESDDDDAKAKGLLTQPRRAAAAAGRRLPTRKARTASRSIDVEEDDQPATVEVIDVSAASTSPPPVSVSSPPPSEDAQQGGGKSVTKPPAGMGGLMASLAVQASLKWQQMGRGGGAATADAATDGGKVSALQKLRTKSNVSPTPEIALSPSELGLDEAKVNLMSPRERSQVMADARKAYNLKHNLGDYQSAIKNAVERVHVKSLTRCVGKLRIHARLVAPVVASLCERDAYVLDCDRVVYVYVGRKASLKVAHKAKAVAEIIKAHERGGSARVVVIDPKAGDGGAADVAAFWSELGAATAPPLPDDASDPDAWVKEKWTFGDALYEVTVDAADIENRNVGVSLLKTDNEKLSMHVLSSAGGFVLDCGSEVYAWCGKEASDAMRTAVLAAGERVLADPRAHVSERGVKTHARLAGARVERVSQGAEPVLFREKFADWPDLSHEVAQKWTERGVPKDQRKRIESATDYIEKKSNLPDHFDVADMLASQLTKPVPYSNGCGELRVWYMAGMDTRPLAVELYGQFWSESCFVIEYQFKKLVADDIGYSESVSGTTEAKRTVVFFWLGLHAKAKARGAASEQAKRLCRELCAAGRDARTQSVEQAAVDADLLQALRGRYTVHTGAYEPDTALCHPKPDAVKSPDERGGRLYHVKRSTLCGEVTAVECLPVLSSMCSRDCFALLSCDGDVRLWQGKGADKALRVAARKLAARLAHLVKQLSAYGAASGKSGAGDDDDKDDDANGAAGGGDDAAGKSASAVALELTETRDAVEDEGVALFDEADAGDTARFAKGLDAFGAPTYADADVFARADVPPPRLWRLDDTGKLYVTEELGDFHRNDLTSKDVAVLDTSAQLVIWQGKAADDKRKQTAAEMVQAYIQRSQPPRLTKDVLLVNEDAEPALFRACFHSWSTSIKGFNPSSVAALDSARTPRGGPAVMTLDEFIELNNRRYSLAELQAAAKDKRRAPKGVDVNRLEFYLTDDDFAKAFGFSKADYAAMPKWKAVDAKKKLNLF
jgi:hypothetical protein